jgi:soluble lytic murein transglycosylase-like protein
MPVHLRQPAFAPLRALRLRPGRAAHGGHPGAPRLYLALLLAVTLTLSLPPAFSSPVSDQAGTITAVQENGRTVYVNAGEPRPSARARSRHSVLVYWSNTEHRWKPVPAPSRAALRAARHAAAEVRGYIAARPRAEDESATVADPNYAGLARGYRVTAEEIDSAIQQSAAKHGVDPNLVRAVVKVESNFNPNAVSRTGAMGLMQLMPGTARSLSVSNPFDPQQNVDAGVRHLKHLLTNFGGDVRLSLAAYNAGEAAVARNGGVPPYAETQNYVKRITDLYGKHGGQVFAPSSAPVHVYRGPDGVLRMSNTE